MTPKETFEEEILKLGLTKLQIISIKILGLELARDEWKDGYDTCNDITVKTLGFLIK